MSRLRPIHHTFAPHVNGSYVLRTLTLLLQPWKWKQGIAHESLREALAQKYGADVFLFSSGREALVALFRALKVPERTEVIVQAYTCLVVPNAIQAAGKTPVYADIEQDTLNLCVADVERRLTTHTCAVMCQHTFGIPADTRRLRSLCDRYDLALIEDCAHIMPDSRGPESIGKDGDFVLLSFGRDKAISGITGGAILSRRPDVSVRLKAEEGAASPLPLLTILRLLCYPIVYAVARPLYGFGVGKALLWSARRLGALVPILTQEEKRGRMSPLLHALPNACAVLAFDGLNALQAVNDHRRALTRFYFAQAAERKWNIPRAIHPDLPLQKFPLFTRNAESIRRTLKKKNIHLHDGWTSCAICPPGSPLDEMHYHPGTDPEAEAAAQMILSLPTHPTMGEAQARVLANTLDAAL